METIESHQFDKLFAERNLENLEKRLLKMLEVVRNKKKRFGHFYKVALETLIYNLALKRDSKSSITYLQLSVQAIATHFQLVSNPGKPININFLNEETLITGYTTSYKIDPIVWIEAIYLALIARDSIALNTLIEVEEDIFKNSKAIYDNFFLEYFYFLKSVFTKDGKAGQRLIKLYNFTEDKHIKIASLTFIDHTILPILELWVSVLSPNKEHFDNRLQQAIEKHKIYWSSYKTLNPNDSPLSTYYEGYFSIPITALMCLAKDCDHLIQIQSDYTPSFLI